MSNREDQIEYQLAARRRWALSATAVVAIVTLGAASAAYVVSEPASMDASAGGADLAEVWDAVSPLGSTVSWQNPLRPQPRTQAGKAPSGNAMKRPGNQNAPRPSQPQNAQPQANNQRPQGRP